MGFFLQRIRLNSTDDHHARWRFYEKRNEDRSMRDDDEAKVKKDLSSAVSVRRTESRRRVVLRPLNRRCETATPSFFH